ncbi:hypothetical protein EI94DRAFT_1701916 [Lactarius quietus]|nr:hypothetical protein EI94DRAFT_1701916 [Lactarius quietus]
MWRTTWRTGDSDTRMYSLSTHFCEMSGAVQASCSCTNCMKYPGGVIQVHHTVSSRPTTAPKLHTLNTMEAGSLGSTLDTSDLRWIWINNDKSKIIWSYDQDESIPFPLSGASDSSHSNTFSHVPATIVAEAAEAADMEAAERASNTLFHRISGNKCKATNDLSNSHTPSLIKTVIDVDSNHTSDGHSNGGTMMPVLTEPADDDYESLKAMADANNLAVTFKSWEDHTADICIIFCHDREYVHPVRRKTMDVMIITWMITKQIVVLPTE